MHGTIPTLLSLQGRIDDQVLESAIENVRQEEFSGWRVIGDTTSSQTVGTRLWLRLLGSLFNVIVSLFFTAPSPGNFGEARASLKVRTIVLECQSAPHRREVMRFQNLGLYNGLPLWLRL